MIEHEDGELLNYEEDTEIDVDSLDVEWLRQPELGLRYGSHVVHLRQIVKDLDEKKKTIRSELIRKANTNPVKYCHKEKPNASDIEAYYRTHKRYKEVVRELQEKETELELAEVARREVAITRKQTLEQLVVLHGQMYFAGPRVPRNLREEWLKKKQETEKRINERVSKKLNKKKKRRKNNG